ncbi:MAG TPA: TAXI family TRAP transporter solute-binding subunit [Myxococcales bacterium]|jgi:TRAP transporter TAXI family solute receptor
MTRTNSLRERFSRLTHFQGWAVVTLLAVAVVAAFAVAFHYVKPAPPKRIVLATASDEGGFKFYARRYVRILKREGIELVTRETDGSVQNVALLADPSSGVDVAFVQSGTAHPAGPASGDAGEESGGIVSLGGLSYVPLWVFYRGEPVEDLSAFKGRRIAVGAPASGTRALAVQLLKLNGADQAPTTLLPMDRKEGAGLLVLGEIDVLFFVAPAEAPAIRKLAAMPGIHLLDFVRAEAYVRRLPSLTRLTLPRGVLDLSTDTPARDLTLLSPTATLVARDSLHPALAYLLMRAATEVHGGPGLMDREGEFPAPVGGGFPLSDQAQRYYKSGAPFLQRYLPFWAANLIDRLWVMLVPLIAVLVPLIRAVPPLFAWRMRARIHRWYARLKETELQLDERPGMPRLQELLERLEKLEDEVNRSSLPISYSENLYAYRQNLALVRGRIAQRMASEREQNRAG